jgi:hypothetical protein
MMAHSRHNDTEIRQVLEHVIERNRIVFHARRHGIREKPFHKVNIRGSQPRGHIVVRLDAVALVSSGFRRFDEPAMRSADIKYRTSRWDQFGALIQNSFEADCAQRKKCNLSRVLIDSVDAIYPDWEFT